MTRAVIIDDERPARADLRRLLAAHPSVTIVGEAALLSDARALLRSSDYDLVFLDVQLLGGTGFDLVPEVRPSARIIFVTAFDHFAFRAFEINALDYLQKPVRVPRLAESLARLEQLPPSARLPSVAFEDIVHLKTGPGTARFVRVNDIVTIISQDNYSELLLAHGEKVFVRQTLSAWEERLPPSHFMRVHRQTLVALPRIGGFTHDSDDITLLQIAGAPAPVRARRHHLPELSRRLTALGIRH